MPTIDQLRQDIASKQTALETCNQKLKELTRQRASQQGKVTKKEDRIYELTNQSSLTATESANLANLKRELISDKQELESVSDKRAIVLQKKMV